MKNIRIFHLKIFIFLVVKFSVYLNRYVFVMLRVLLDIFIIKKINSDFKQQLLIAVDDYLVK